MIEWHFNRRFVRDYVIHNSYLAYENDDGQINVLLYIIHIEQWVTGIGAPQNMKKSSYLLGNDIIHMGMNTVKVGLILNWAGDFHARLEHY